MKLNISNKDVSDNQSHFDSNEANICNIFSKIQIEEVNDNIGTYDSENNSMNGEVLIILTDQDFLKKKILIIYL